MMDLLQWTGAILILTSYLTIPKYPVAGWAISTTGCVLCAVWFILIEPVAWGMLGMEVVLGVIAGRNYLNAVHA